MMQILFSILMIVLIAGFLLTVSGRFLIAAVIFAFLLALRRSRRKAAQQSGTIPPSKKNPEVVIGAIVLLILFLPAPVMMETSAMWRYPFQKVYLDFYQNIGVPNWFPDFRDDVRSNYRMNYLASILQGTGHFSVRFMTTPERAAELAEQYAAQAKYTAAMPETTDTAPIGDLTVPENERIPFALSEWDGTADYYCDRDFWYPDGQCLPEAKIYILDARGNRNHPASSAVIISSSGAVQLSQYGSTGLAYGRKEPGAGLQ